MSSRIGKWLFTASAAGCALAASTAFASSHREAPFITENPKVDGTDFYMFKSYEKDRQGFVTLIANYQPLQAAYGGPNYFTMDPNAIYEILIDNNGDAMEDLTFRFKFDNDLINGGKGKTLPTNGKDTAIPLVNFGGVSSNDTSNLNQLESYTVELIRGKRFPTKLFEKIPTSPITNAADGSKNFKKPVDYIGTKTFNPMVQSYGDYAKTHIYAINVPGCNTKGQLFVGQRAESFAVNLGTIFDLVNAPVEVIAGGVDRASRNLVPSTIKDANITTLALELPISCLKGSGDVIGGWTASALPQVRVLNPEASYEQPSLEGGAWVQTSRLSAPLVNEVVIGMPDKDLFNTSQPKNDGQFLSYVTNPSLPELIEILFGSAGAVAPNVSSRDDLVAAFLKGVPNVNANGSTAEMMRLNTALPATEKGKQNSLGALNCFVFGKLTLDNPGCDPAGFPNGRRPGDDAVDIALRVVMGVLLPADVAPAGQLALTDATLQEDAQFDDRFPYLRTPTPGAR